MFRAMQDSSSECVQQEFADLSTRFGSVYVILSPPRCGSTVLARVFWEQPSVRYYAHEPFERMYYGKLGLASAFEALNKPIDLTKYYKPAASGSSLVVKDITFQVGPHAGQLFSLARKPVLFLIRNPRLSILSKILGRLEVSLPVPIPDLETGWESLAAQVRLAQELQVPYVVVDFADLQNSPHKVLSAICDRWGLPEASPTFAYETKPDIPLDNLGGIHMHFYRRALTSSAIERATTTPKYTDFSHLNSYGTHLDYCQRVYDRLLRSPVRING